MQSAYEYTFAASLILDQIYEQNVKSFLVTCKGRKNQQKIYITLLCLYKPMRTKYDRKYVGGFGIVDGSI